MKPLTPLKYFAENKKRAVTVIAVLMLAAALVSFVTSLITSIIIDASKANLDPLKSMSLVMGTSDDLLMKESVINKIKGFEEVDKIYDVYIQNTLFTTLVGNTSSFVIAPDNPAEIAAIMEDVGLTLSDGRLPEAGGEFEIAMHERLLANKGLSIGDYIGGDHNDNEWLSGSYAVVGSLSGEGTISFSNKNSNKENFLNAGMVFDRPVTQILVPKPGKLDEMNEKIEQFGKNEASYHTHSSLERMFEEQLASLNTILFIMVFVVVFVISISISALIYIVYMNRSEEFGILYAMGYRKSFIKNLIIKELSSLSFISWALGYLFSWLMISLVNILILNPSGQTLYFFTLTGLLNTLIIPVMVIICAVTPMLKKLRRWDPIAVIERRE